MKKNEVIITGTWTVEVEAKDEEQAEDDWNLEVNGVHVLVDSMSGGYLQGAEVDYKDDAMGSSFSIKNPTAVTTCGCGSSFSPY